MMLPEIDFFRWDAYQAFHQVRWNDAGLKITQFDTGELLIQAYNVKPDARRKFSALNLEVVSSHDDACPEMTHADGTPVKVEWLRQSAQQILLIDHDTRQVVRLDGPQRRPDARIPARFNGDLIGGAVTWFAGPGRAPVPAKREVTVSPPTAWTTEQRRHVHGLHRAAIAWRAMQDDETQRRLNNTSSPSIPVEIAALVACATFNDMPEKLRLQCTRQGLTAGRTTTTVPHLLLARTEAP